VSDVLDLSDATNSITIEGDALDSVTVTDGTWSDDRTGVVPGYHQYTLGAATLLINTTLSDVTIPL